MGQYWQGGLLNVSANVKKTKKSIKITDAVVEFSACAHDVAHGLRLMQHSWLTSHYVNLFVKRLRENPARVVWAGDYGDEFTINGEQAYDYLDNNESKVTDEKVDTPEPRYLINYDKKEFVDTTKGRPNFYGCVIHPLPLLTANSNGRGNGDYHDKNKYKNKYIGTWYADVIGAADELPTDIELTEIIPDFFEG